MLTQTLETILPIDYYSKMIGLCVDQKVLEHLIQARMPKLWQHLNVMENSVCIAALNFMWVNLFVNFLSTQAEYFVWDLLFVLGSAVLFRVTLTLLELMEEDIL